MEMIEIENLTKKYNDKLAVDNLNLKIWLKISMLSLTMGHGQFEGLVTVELPRPLGHRNKRGFGREKLQSTNEQK